MSGKAVRETMGFLAVDASRKPGGPRTRGAKPRSRGYCGRDTVRVPVRRNPIDSEGGR